MNTRLAVLAAALAMSQTAWAATENVDVYGAFTLPPNHQTYSSAAIFGENFFGSSFVPQTDTTILSNATAQISGTDYSASARTTLGNNHVYASASTLPSGAFGVVGFSGWYDQVTITGETGTGTLQFSVNLTGTVSVGALGGAAGYGLLASSVNPSQLTSELTPFRVMPLGPWALDSDQVTEIALYDVVASPYNDPSQFFLLNTSPATPGSGISIDPINPLEGDMGFPEYVPDLVLTPGANQPVNVTLTGSLTFTYGEAFYLIGALGTTVLGDGLEAFTEFGISDSTARPAVDGTGPTTLDFANSAHLVGIVLPQGASFASASGAAYNVTAVPEPGEWLMLLAGLGLVGWRAARRRA